MSGLYNAVFGMTEDAPYLVYMLNLVVCNTSEDALALSQGPRVNGKIPQGPMNFGRFRDAWVEMHGDIPMIRVHTRNGGSNREDQTEAIASMQAHPWFVMDHDDGFDPTYADFYFAPNLEQVPDEYKDAVMRKLISIAKPVVNTTERWEAAIAKMNSDPDEADRVMKEMDKHISVHVIEP